MIGLSTIKKTTTGSKRDPHIKSHAEKPEELRAGGRKVLLKRRRTIYENHVP